MCIRQRAQTNSANQRPIVTPSSQEARFLLDLLSTHPPEGRTATAPTRPKRIRTSGDGLPYSIQVSAGKCHGSNPHDSGDMVPAGDRLDHCFFGFPPSAIFRILGPAKTGRNTPATKFFSHNRRRTSRLSTGSHENLDRREGPRPAKKKTESMEDRQCADAPPIRL